jgi:hypothetical protein
MTVACIWYELGTALANASMTSYNKHALSKCFVNKLCEVYAFFAAFYSNKAQEPKRAVTAPT